MSDLRSDAAAMQRLAQKLTEAASQLREAIKEAERGHRGMTLPIEPHVNEVLQGSGYELRMAPDNWRSRR